MFTWEIMSSLFKNPIHVLIVKESSSNHERNHALTLQDPINSNLAQFDHAQSNSKKWPKGEKDQIPPNDFFSRKTTNKIFMYLSAPFILQNFKKIPRADPEL